MSAGPLAGIRACVFDAYGTLFDYASAARRCRDALGGAWEPLAAMWRDKQLQYTWLRAAGLKTAILSNGTPAMLAAAVDKSAIGDLLDAVLSVEEAGVFKPHPRVYQLAVDRLGIAPQAMSFQSANAWDAWAASAFGMRAVWCNRYGQRAERLPGRPSHEIRTLAELPALLGA
ncbi:MAG: HAD-IA family hydrolase [Betaproteobacteria bacterium]|nr:HAD-IA family hydrolase [Betaproteobacteria bacterium]